VVFWAVECEKTGQEVAVCIGLRGMAGRPAGGAGRSHLPSTQVSLLHPFPTVFQR
jgi:hypothetical protein